MKRSPLAIVLLLILVTILGGCSGGGESSGGSALSRTFVTGLRLVHGGFDETAVAVDVDGQLFSAVNFAEATFYRPLTPGNHTLRVYRANAPLEVIQEFSYTFEKGTEYSLLIAGRDLGERFDLQLIGEPVERLEIGRARLRLYHAHADHSSLRLASDHGSTGPASFAGSSAAVDVPTGTPFNVSVVDDDGRAVASTVVFPPDRGEVALMISGSRDVGYLILREFLDLD